MLLVGWEIAAAAPLLFPNALGEGDCPAGVAQVELAMVGDLMAHLSQVQAAQREDGAYDFQGQFASVAPELRRADVTLGNLETVFGGEGAGGFTGFRRFNTPDALALALRDAGFDLLQTANNHCMDRDPPGLRRTLDVLDAYGLGHAGTFRTAEEASEPGYARFELPSGLVLAFLAATYSTNGYWPPADEPWLVTFSWRLPPLAEVITRARSQGAHLVVVGVHTGLEYSEVPEDWFVTLADQLVAAGADVVMGTHPHVLQPAAVRTVARPEGPRDSALLYSLGNFVSAMRQPGADGGVIARLQARHCVGDPASVRLSRLGFLPTWVDATAAGGEAHYRVLPLGSRPWVAEGDLSEADVRAASQHRARVARLFGEENLEEPAAGPADPPAVASPSAP